MSGLAEMAFQSNEKVQNLYSSFTQFLAEARHLDRFLEHVEAHRSIKPPQITAYLARLGKGALPGLVAWMGRMGTAVHRRAVTEAVLSHETEDALEELGRHVPPHRDILDAAFTREALHILANLPTEHTFPLVENLLSSSHATTRREAIQALGRFPDQQIDPLCLRLLGDGDIEVRSTALDILVRSGRETLAEPILDHTTRARGFDDRGLSEKRRIFAAVAKLGGPGSLDWFTEMLSQEGRKWFASRREREAREAVIHGIRIVGTEQARRLLREMAESGDRHVRAACLKELAAERGTA
jgi:HEAT repeat protein